MTTTNHKQISAAATAKHLVDTHPYFASLKYNGKSGFCIKDAPLTNENITTLHQLKKIVLLLLLKEYDTHQQTMAYLNGVVKALTILTSVEPKKRKHQAADDL